MYHGWVLLAITISLPALDCLASQEAGSRSDAEDMGITQS